jgi:hypothetical protein
MFPFSLNDTPSFLLFSVFFYPLLLSPHGIANQAESDCISSSSRLHRNSSRSGRIDQRDPLLAFLWEVQAGIPSIIIKVFMVSSALK